VGGWAVRVAELRIVLAHAPADHEVEGIAHCEGPECDQVGLARVGGSAVGAVAHTVPAVPVNPDIARKLRSATAKHEQWRSERDRLIVAASLAGATTREIGELVGLSHVHVSRLVNKAYRNRLLSPIYGTEEEQGRHREKLWKELRELYPEAFKDPDTSSGASTTS